MAYVEWSMQGWEVANCNCNWGCPCQFNQLPSHGNCCALAFVQIERGHFGELSLDGLRWAVVAAWPGAIHEGNGRFLTLVDEQASPQQRDAIEKISHGEETDPGSLIWQVFSTTISEYLPTQVRPIQLVADLEAATARFNVPGCIEGEIGPMRNPFTGAPHRARLSLASGFEYREAEFASGSSRCELPIPLHFNDSFAFLTRIHWSTHGLRN